MFLPSVHFIDIYKIKIKRASLTSRLMLLISMCLVTFTGFTLEVREDREPEAATGFVQKSGISADKFMVVAANPYATEAGFNILKRGGSAVDAAIAVQLVLTLVEPQSSGIGGGSFMLHWHNKDKKLTSFDGRETAPSNVNENLFIDKNGKRIPWMKAVVGGRSVGVPGVLASLKQAHQQYGILPWHTLFDEAIDLAENGFIVSPRLEKLLKMQFNPGITALPEIKQYFFPKGEVVKAGQRLRNSKLARVYRLLAKEGITPFYQGEIAKKIVKAVRNSPIAPGALTLKDLNGYQAKERDAVCGQYKQYNVCGMGPPSSGGIAVIQILAQLQKFNLAQLSPTSFQYLHLFTQSSRLAFADRDRYIADNDFVHVPVTGLLDEQYLAQRATLIHPSIDMGRAAPGEPKSEHVMSIQADNQTYELPSTSHLSIVDGLGNAISMTSSIEMAFGSAVMVEGFILNNQLTDFSFTAEKEGRVVANKVAPLKRPRSSMAPMMVFNNDGSLKLVIGSPGGSRIINYVAQKLLLLLDHKLSPQLAVSMPNVTNRNKVTTLEKNTVFTTLEKDLQNKKHKVAIKDLNSGLHVIAIEKGRLQGGVDPRREGKAMGL